MSEHCTMVYSLLKLSVRVVQGCKDADAGKDGVLSRPDKRHQAVTFNCKQA